MGLKWNYDAFTWSWHDDGDGDPLEAKKTTAAYYWMIFAIFIAVVVAELLFIILLMRLMRQPSVGNSARTLIVLGSGGHTAEMLKLVESLDKARYTPRMYVSAISDAMSGRKAADYEQSLSFKATETGSSPDNTTKKVSRDNAVNGDPTKAVTEKEWELYEIPRSREVGQSYITSIQTTIVAILSAIVLVFRTRPEVVLVNGPGTCIPVCFAAALYKLFGLTPCKIIYVESIARTRKLSLSGKILYHSRMADLLLVQWKELADKLPRAKFAGRLY